VIGQVTPRLGLAVTDPLDEEPDGPPGITHVDGLDGNARNAHSTTLAYAQRRVHAADRVSQIAMALAARPGACRLGSTAVAVKLAAGHGAQGNWREPRPGRSGIPPGPRSASRSSPGGLSPGSRMTRTPTGSSRACPARAPRPGPGPSPGTGWPGSVPGDLEQALAEERAPARDRRRGGLPTCRPTGRTSR
jgi:hypothetical protein